MSPLREERFEGGGRAFAAGLWAPEEEEMYCPHCGAEVGMNGVLYRRRDGGRETVGCGACVKRICL